MNEIVYAAPWSKDKINSWSGTIYFLRESLGKKSKIFDIDTEVFHSRHPAVIAYRLRRKWKAMIGKTRQDMKVDRLAFMNNIIKEPAIDVSVPVLQFEECPDFHSGRRQYIYQDLTVGFIEELYHNDRNLFNLSGFQSNSLSDIEKRKKQQDDFYGRADGILTMSHWLSDYIISHRGGNSSDKVYCIGGGMNLDVSMIDGKNKVGNKILFVGKDFERKNGPLVIEAFKKAHLVRPDIELYIAGPKSLSLSIDGIKCLGRLTFEQLVPYYNMCDIFCMPSMFEAYGIVFPEALTFGLPCIGRNAFEMPYFIENKKTGFLLESENAEELSRMMLDLLNAKIIAENVRNRREGYIREYSWDAVAERIVNILFDNNKML